MSHIPFAYCIVFLIIGENRLTDILAAVRMYKADGATLVADRHNAGKSWHNACLY